MPPENNQNFNNPVPQQPTPEKKSSGLNTVLLILLIALVGFGIWYLSQNNKNVNSQTQVQEEQVNQEIDGEVVEEKKEEIEKPTETFLDTLIKNGADKIYKYSYNGNEYYYVMDWEIIGVDGTPDVYALNGTKINCNFGSPMSPNPNSQQVNPICVDYESGAVIYVR